MAPPIFQTPFQTISNVALFYPAPSLCQVLAVNVVYLYRWGDNQDYHRDYALENPVQSTIY